MQVFICGGVFYSLTCQQMKANLQILDALLAVAMQFAKSPDKEVESAATDELQELIKRRAKLLKADRLCDVPQAPTPTEGASREAALAA